MSHRSRLAVPIALMLIAACGGDGADPGSTTSSTHPGTSLTTTAIAVSTTTVPRSTTTAPTTTVAGDPLAPEGSGCTPGTEELPDGLWYGEVDDMTAQGINFDLACWFSGEAAIGAAAEDGEESPPPNDYYVRNQNNQIRSLAVAPATHALWFESGDPSDFLEGTFSEWAQAVSSRGFFFGIWVTIEGGEVTSIDEQWVP